MGACKARVRGDLMRRMEHIRHCCVLMRTRSKDLACHWFQIDLTQDLCRTTTNEVARNAAKTAIKARSAGPEPLLIHRRTDST